MKVFIPLSDLNESLLNSEGHIIPFLIEAYEYHLGVENTQNFDIKKVMTGTVTNNKGKTKVPYSSL